MNEIIGKRKSIRKYDLSPLDAETLENIREQIENVTPLYPDIRYSIEIANGIKGVFNNVKAPHYLVFFSEEKNGSYENVGFIGQQLNLFFAGAGIGACWLGATKPGETEEFSKKHIASMSFGKPAEPLLRELSDFKRKPLAEISEGIDARLEAARLAPSAVNSQNWFFVAENDKIHCYRKKANPLLGFIYNKLHCIDMGIALYHIALESNDFRFEKESDVPERNGYVYMGTVS